MTEAAALFKEHDAGLVQGGFGHVSANVLKGWHSQEKLVIHGNKEKPGAVAHVSLVKKPKKVYDFSGRHIATMEPNDIFFKRVAWTDQSRFHDLIHEYDYTHRVNDLAPVIWVEEFIEYDKQMQDCGFKRVCTKIRSDSTMIGVYAHWWEEQGRIVDTTSQADQVTLEPLSITVPSELIDSLVSELREQGVEWADHYSHYNVNHTWAAVTLRGYGGLEDFIIKPSEMSKKWKEENADKMNWQIQDTPARARLSQVEPLVDLIPGNKHRVRLMRLKAGSELLRHADITDPEAGTLEGSLMRIHIPIATNEECSVRQWTLDGKEKDRNMKVGEAWYLDTRKPHAVRNGGSSDRIHLVMDVESNRELRQLLGMEEENNQLEEWI